MPLPTLEKTWTFNVNQAVPVPASTGEMNRRAAVAIIQSFKGLGWTVVGSSSSTAAGMDGVDRVNGDYTKWVVGQTTQVRSWVVLASAGMGGAQLCFHAWSNTSTSFENNWSLVFSPAAGFTGGSTTARPTATDEVLANSNGSSSTDVVSASNSAISVHAMGATDGTQFRVFVTGGGVVKALILVGLVPDGPTGFIGKACGHHSSTGGAAGFSTWATSTAGPFRTTQGGVTSVLGLWTMNVPANATTYPNALDGTYPMFGILAVNGTLPYQGVMGRLVDVWAGPVRQAGATFPEDGSHQFVSLDGMILPWNGSVPAFSP